MVRIFRKMRRLRLNSKARKAFHGSSRGFSMLEVVIAIGLLGIIAVSVLVALQTAALALISADRRATAESIARTQMEWVRYSNYDDDLAEGHPQYSLDPQITLPPDYGVETTAIRLNKDLNPDDDDGIQQITVTVSHEDIVVVTLEDYKRK
ncbi:MAG: type II secretion system protein [Chloroflexota bacterium]|nr:MAG: type II secretion system protein [Chloroflexota bacterium]